MANKFIARRFEMEGNTYVAIRATKLDDFNQAVVNNYMSTVPTLAGKNITPRFPVMRVHTVPLLTLEDTYSVTLYDPRGVALRGFDFTKSFPSGDVFVIFKEGNDLAFWVLNTPHPFPEEALTNANVDNALRLVASATPKIMDDFLTDGRSGYPSQEAINVPQEGESEFKSEEDKAFWADIASSVSATTLKKLIANATSIHARAKMTNQDGEFEIPMETQVHQAIEDMDNAIYDLLDIPVEAQQVKGQEDLEEELQNVIAEKEALVDQIATLTDQLEESQLKLEEMKREANPMYMTPDEIETIKKSIAVIPGVGIISNDVPLAKELEKKVRYAFTKNTDQAGEFYK